MFYGRPMYYVRVGGADSPLVKKNYYARLGVKRKATKEQIVAAYRKLALVMHPDRRRNVSKGMAMRDFQLINEAYAVLRDPEKRAAYNKTLPKRSKPIIPDDSLMRPGADMDEDWASGTTSREKGLQRRLMRCDDWWREPRVHPVTRKRVTINSAAWRKLERSCGDYIAKLAVNGYYYARDPKGDF
jgi:curved DNA-binding protein CbpA